MTGGTSSLGIDTTVPTTARMYDFWLGGHDNFAADRAAALAVSEAAPEVRLIAVENRKFLRRVVRYLAAESGIAQFLDIGTGLPTQGNVHQVAQAINPDARVMYVDNDPMVLAHSRALKTGGNTAVIEADLRDPETVLNHPGTRALIDFGQPLAVLLVAVLHFVSDNDDPHAVVAAIRDALLSTRASSRCRTGGPMNPRRQTPAGSGFSARSGASPMQPASKAMPVRPGAARSARRLYAGGAPTECNQALPCRSRRSSAGSSELLQSNRVGE